LGEYKNPRSHSTIRGSIQPQIAAPGDTIRLTLSAEPADQWHVYALANQAPAVGSKPTLIVFNETSGLEPSTPKPSSQPVRKPADGPTGFEQVYHEGPVSWTVEIKLPADAPHGEYPIGGLMGYQTCWAKNCDLPQATEFSATLTIAAASKPGELPLAFADAKYGEAAKLAAQRSESKEEASSDAPLAVAGFDPTQIRSNLSDTTGGASVPLMMVFGFLGGLILNLMPCVLPVIGLKILSFVEQSGQDRSRVLWLNIWYSLGLLSVFIVLALLAIFLGLGWGQQFSSSTFNVVLAAIVFAMGLSFLGVWEIPIPGFVGSGKANDLAAQEGVAGAFAKGVITTVLATPCTGPFLGTSLAWAVRQPPHLTMLLFLCVGVGMASPYLLIGMFPSLVRVLPKPGMWMETFKQTMGFVLLGTVVFLLTFIEWSLVVPTVALLFGIWAACWWIGRTPYTADLSVKARSWMGALTFVAAVALVSFNWLHAEMDQRLLMFVDRQIGDRMQSGPQVTTVAQTGHRLPWQSFSQQSLQQSTGQQKTVMVDFTADWCLICKTLEKVVLNTEDVKKVVDTNQIVPMLADWTNGDEEVTAMLELLGSKQVPVLAIFPAGRPNEPIVFRDPYTQEQLIEALRKAGPSKAIANAQTTAMNLK
jgi:thiol:disulfide interchange protein